MTTESTFKSVADLWAAYRKVIPTGAGVNQIIETRRAFYVGALSLFQLIVNSMENEQGGPTENDIAFMDSIHKELMRFYELIQNGVA